MIDNNKGTECLAVHSNILLIAHNHILQIFKTFSLLKGILCITDFSLKSCWNHFPTIFCTFNSKLSHAEKEICILQIFQKRICWNKFFKNFQTVRSFLLI